jgi:aspartyl-tRNA(Asn)/glutamyl-tRNA(Gln) amidotransferase subunit B
MALPLLDILSLKELIIMFETIIGLEVHVQLNTQSKLFCSCPTSFNAVQNTNTCPTCLALPGALPVLNGQAVLKGGMFGTAVNATINRTSFFDRKSYFYPDSPSAYQITLIVLTSKQMQAKTSTKVLFQRWI